MQRKLKMGMVGGGKDAFIGAVHRFAANLDGRIELVAGAFSSNPKKSQESGALLLLDPNRVYDSYEGMAEAEAKLPVGERIDFVSIVTPNFAHFPVAKRFLEAGFNVVCDKPVTLNLEEAVKLRDIVRQSGKVFALTHNYTGYPMVKEAREMVRAGELGKILKIVTEYPQGWLLNPIDQEGHKGASWRTDPERAGASGCIGDIGTHAENVARYITGLEIEELCADFTSFVEGRRLEDDGNMLVRYKGGAKGVLYASQSRLVRRTISRFGSMEQGRRWNGIKSIRTNSSLNFRTRLERPIGAAIAISAMSPRGSSGCPSAIRKRLSKPLPISTSRPPGPSKQR